MLRTSPAAAESLPCSACDGSGIEPGCRLRAHSEGFDGECSSCDGTGIARCETRRCSEEAIRVVGDMRCCSACAVLADADIAAYEATLCKAGQDHAYLRHHATEQEWSALEYVGQQSDEVETIEHRNCSCHSTICRVIARVVARQDGAGNLTYSAPIAAGAVR